MKRGADTAPGLSTDDPRVLAVAVDRVTGIDFGCDLTLRWPYVLALVPDGSADRTGEILLGDQLVAIAGASVLGLPIGEVMEKLANVEGELEKILGHCAYAEAASPPSHPAFASRFDRC